MNSVYFLLVFSLCVVTLHADYSCSSDACAYAGLGKKSCYGSGTSPIADLLGYIFRDKTQYIIAGSCEGIYFVWGMYYKWQQGAQAIARAETLYAYILEIPKTNCTEHTYLVIQVADCPTTFELEKYTQGVVPSTNLPWASVYRVISTYCGCSYPTECELIQGGSTIFTDTSQMAYSVRLTVSVYLDGLNSFMYKQYGKKDDGKPKKIAKKYNLNVEQGISDPALYVQKGTPNGPKYACKNPYSSPGIGRQLANQNFDVKSVYKPGGLCLLAKRIARIFVNTPSSVIFGYVTFTIIQHPFDCGYQFNTLYSRIDDYAVFQPLFSVC